MYSVCPCISRPYHRAWHIVAYSVNFCWMNESANLQFFNKQYFFDHQTAPACIILRILSKCISSLILPTSLWGHLISVLDRKKEIFSFIHSTSTCYVSGPVLSAGDTELDKTWSLPSRNARFNGGDGQESSCFSAVGKCCERRVCRSRRA